MVGEKDEGRGEGKGEEGRGRERREKGRRRGRRKGAGKGGIGGSFCYPGAKTCCINKKSNFLEFPEIFFDFSKIPKLGSTHLLL
jgi:hypothetical protein